MVPNVDLAVLAAMGCGERMRAAAPMSRAIRLRAARGGVVPLQSMIGGRAIRLRAARGGVVPLQSMIGGRVGLSIKNSRSGLSRRPFEMLLDLLKGLSLRLGKEECGRYEIDDREAGEQEEHRRIAEPADRRQEHGGDRRGDGLVER